MDITLFRNSQGLGENLQKLRETPREIGDRGSAPPAWTISGEGLETENGAGCHEGRNPKPRCDPSGMTHTGRPCGHRSGTGNRTARPSGTGRSRKYAQAPA